MVEESRFYVPRTLVNKLLHVAQLHPSQVRWGIVSGHADNPEHIHQLNSSLYSKTWSHGVLQAIQKGVGKQVWALYCLAPGEIQVPHLNELERVKASRFLGISLGTKGVLQLRGWLVDGDHLRELAVTIRED